MPLRVCEAGGCINPVERVCGSCMICARHYCVEHMKNNYHKCPSEVSLESIMQVSGLESNIDLLG